MPVKGDEIIHVVTIGLGIGSRTRFFRKRRWGGLSPNEESVDVR